MTPLETLPPTLLDPAIRARIVRTEPPTHILEAGDPAHPCVVLLHGFPELAYSWRKILPRLAQAGYYAVAPDLTGYGRTATRRPASHRPASHRPASHRTAYTEDLAPYRMTRRLQDLLALLDAIGQTQVALVGHDYGAWIAGYAALARPDRFTSVVLMSAPFAGPPATADLQNPAALRPPSEDPIHQALAALDPPRKHYHAYFASPAAAPDMDAPNTPDGRAQIARFLRAYYHHKSADWPGNHPHPLQAWTAQALAELPTYYVMPRDRSMPETVAPHMPPDDGAGCPWLTPAELDIYAAEYARTGFQGALQGYRVRMDGSLAHDLAALAGRHVEIPALFIAGDKDWGPFQSPGALDRMRTIACPRMEAIHLVPGAGHWVQQERPGSTADHLLAFLARHSPITRKIASNHTR